MEDPDNPNPLPPSDCGRPQARASDDYGGVRGEWIFTKAGTRTITIPIVDDDLDEADYEAFAVHASQYDDVAGQTTWAAAVIRIVDDDRTDRTGAPPAVTTIVTRPEDGPSDPSPAAGPAQAALAPVPRAAAPTALESPPDLGSESLEPLEPLEPLQPGSGFELVMERDLEPAGERDDRGAGSASWFASGLGIALVGAGVTVWVWRRTRWSTTSS